MCIAHKVTSLDVVVSKCHIIERPQNMEHMFNMAKCPYGILFETHSILHETALLLSATNAADMLHFACQASGVHVDGWEGSFWVLGC